MLNALRDAPLAAALLFAKTALAPTSSEQITCAIQPVWQDFTLTHPLTSAKVVPMTVSLAITAIIVSPVILRLITVNLMVKLEDVLLSKDILRAT